MRGMCASVPSASTAAGVRDQAYRDRFAPLPMTRKKSCHCEERSDEAISLGARPKESTGGHAMAVILGTDGYRYEVNDGWAKLPPGMEFNADVAAVGVDRQDNV